MITDLIVLTSLAFTAIFVAAWALKPHLRAWIERPKYEFQDALQGYDAARRADTTGGGGHPRA